MTGLRRIGFAALATGLTWIARGVSFAATWCEARARGGDPHRAQGP